MGQGEQWVRYIGAIDLTGACASDEEARSRGPPTCTPASFAHAVPALLMPRAPAPARICASRSSGKSVKQAIAKCFKRSSAMLWHHQ